jgi:hypothetical protein
VSERHLGNHESSPLSIRFSRIADCNSDYQRFLVSDLSCLHGAIYEGTRCD